MKPGNRQLTLKWCQFTQSIYALRDERKELYNYVPFCSYLQKGFLFFSENGVQQLDKNHKCQKDIYREDWAGHRSGGCKPEHTQRGDLWSDRLFRCREEYADPADERA